MRRSTNYDIVVEYPTYISVRSYIPEPWQGEPIAYNLRIRETLSGNVIEYQNVPVTYTPNPSTILTYAFISSDTIIERRLHPSNASPHMLIRFNSLTPFTNYTCWFSPITSAGPALVEGGPFHVRTGQTVANQPPAPIICDCAQGQSYVLVLISAPAPPYGIIIRYDIGVPNSADVLKFDVLYSTTNVSSTNVTLPVDGIDASSIRVRAYTALGAGPWSDRAVDKRTVASQKSTGALNGVALGVSLGIIVPIVVLLVIVVVWLARRHRDDMKHPVFPFPPPDRWEIDRTLIEFNELLGLYLLLCLFL
jgi:hypothetical protein